LEKLFKTIKITEIRIIKATITGIIDAKITFDFKLSNNLILLNSKPSDKHYNIVSHYKNNFNKKLEKPYENFHRVRKDFVKLY